MLSSLDEYISENYEEETYYANLLSALTVFSVLVTFSGVFSMLPPPCVCVGGAWPSAG